MTDDIDLPQPDRWFAEDDPMYGVIGNGYYNEVTVRRLIAKAVKKERAALAALCASLPAPSEYGPAEASYWELGTVACENAILDRSK